jgi:[protein-PII] uridylyltransferase
MANLVRDDILADPRLRGLQFCHAYSDRVDTWARQLYVTATGAPEGVALVAVGGYGRRELCPHSDLDLLLIHDPKVDVGDMAQKLWYPIWDAGLKLGHATFTVKEALRLAEDELDSATAYHDARAVAGDRSLGDELVAAAHRQWVKGASRWLPKLRDALTLRTLNPGEVAFLLEPDLKLGRGGLRDAHVLRWLQALEPELLAADREVYEAAHHVLLDTRVALHRRLSRPSDVLALQEQDGVAEDLGMPDADALMGAVAGAARAIGWLTDDAFDRVSLSGSRFRRRARERRLGNRVVVRDGQVHLDEPVSREPSQMAVQLLDVALAAAHQELRIGRATLEAFAASPVPMAEPWPAGVRARFVELLRCGKPMIPVMESLDHWGLLVRLLPEWAPCRSRPQRNAYHRFTVDRHLCEAAANAAELVARVSRPDLLVIGAVLHDIGKGYPPRDHTEVGIELVGDIGARMGFVPPDVAVLQQMVRLHLLLPDAAMTRDLDDPRTIELVAEAVGDEETLDLLAALTEADSLATGPSAWSPWKHGLVDDLCARVRVALSGAERPGDGAAVPALPTDEHRTKMAAGVLDLSVEGSTVTVVCPDRPGLFWRVAGTLAVRGVDVRSAQAASEGGMAVEVFEVQPALERLPDWDRVRADLALAVDDRLALEAALAERARVYAPRFKAKAARPAEPRVLFHDDASEVSTVVEVRAPDGIGVLYRITRALAEVGLDVRTAKVLTLGHEVVDSFYVRDAGGAKVTGDAQRTAIEQAVLAAL